jgi:hypothetical protein
MQPSAHKLWAFDSKASSDRAARMVRAPARAICCAIARPIPRLAPATKAVFPSREKTFRFGMYLIGQNVSAEETRRLPLWTRGSVRNPLDKGRDDLVELGGGFHFDGLLQIV